MPIWRSSPDWHYGWFFVLDCQIKAAVGSIMHIVRGGMVQQSLTLARVRLFLNQHNIAAHPGRKAAAVGSDRTPPKSGGVVDTMQNRERRQTSAFNVGKVCRETKSFRIVICDGHASNPWTVWIRAATSR
jgi:hypothetical protein